jgi:hypothetical protein
MPLPAERHAHHPGPTQFLFPLSSKNSLETVRTFRLMIASLASAQKQLVEIGRLTAELKAEASVARSAVVLRSVIDSLKCSLQILKHHMDDGEASPLQTPHQQAIDAQPPRSPRARSILASTIASPLTLPQGVTSPPAGSRGMPKSRAMQAAQPSRSSANIADLLGSRRVNSGHNLRDMMAQSRARVASPDHSPTMPDRDVDRRRNSYPAYVFAGSTYFCIFCQVQSYASLILTVES